MIEDEDLGLGQLVRSVLALPFAGEARIRRRALQRRTGGTRQRIVAAAGWWVLWLLYPIAIATYLAFAVPLVVGSLVIGALVVLPLMLVMAVLTVLEPAFTARFRTSRRSDQPSLEAREELASAPEGALDTTHPLISR
jgi:hypothetical protein